MFFSNMSLKWRKRENTMHNMSPSRMKTSQSHGTERGKERKENQPDIVLVDRERNHLLVFDFSVVVNDGFVWRRAKRKVEKDEYTTHLLKQKEKLSFSMVIPVVISNN